MNEIIVDAQMAIHLFAGIGALFTGVIQLFLIAKGTKEHKMVGRVWAFCMLVLVLTTLTDMVDDGWLSMPAMIFTAMAIIFVPLGIYGARTRKFTLHKFSMGLMVLVSVAATIALIAIPGRLLHTWFIG